MTSLPKTCIRGALCFAFLLPSLSWAVPTGTYRCWQYNVSGGGGSCRTAAPIVIRPDGTYQESRTTGTYRQQGERITFSASKIRGAGTLIGENQLRFEYDYRGLRHTVTYLCQDCQAGKQAGRSVDAAPASPPAVDLSVRLRFDASDGYLGWASTAHLVPLQAASSYVGSDQHSPPAGTFTGLAWLDGKTVVASRFRAAKPGQQYAVVLDSGREKIIVATLRVPLAPATQEIELKASLAGGGKAAAMPAQ